MKKVTLKENVLLISNFRREVEIPLSDIGRVSGSILLRPELVWLHFRRPTEFGWKVVFTPKVRFLSFVLTRHPVVKELEQLVKTAPHVSTQKGDESPVGQVSPAQAGWRMRNGYGLIIPLLVGVLAMVILTRLGELRALFYPEMGAPSATPARVQAHTSGSNANKLLIGKSAETISGLPGAYAVPLHPMENLNFKTRQEIYRLRKECVLRHPDLAPEKYAPSEAVFGQIADKRPWWGIYGIYFYGNGEKSIEGPSEQSIFLLNPYLLVGLREPHGFRTQLTPPDEHVVFYPRPLGVQWDSDHARALIIYNVHDHYQHLTTHHYYPTPEYRLDLIAYNARDLGLPYLYVDTDKSEDVAPLQRMEKKAFPINQFLHCGGSCGYPGGCNNISPAGQPQLTIEIKKLPARVQLKLWRNEPKSVDDRCDMTVTIQML